MIPVCPNMDNVETFQRKARRVIAEHGLTIRDLAAKTGLSIRYVYNLLEGSSVTRRGREKIEDVLGPLWTDPLDFMRRKQQQQEAGGMRHEDK